MFLSHGLHFFAAWSKVSSNKANGLLQGPIYQIHGKQRHLPFYLKKELLKAFEELLLLPLILPLRQSSRLNHLSRKLMLRLT